MQSSIRLLLPFAIACGGDPKPPATPDASMTSPMIDSAPLPETDAAQPPRPVELAAGESAPSSVAVYLGEVYWTTDPVTTKGAVKKLVAGNAPVTLAMNEDAPRAIAVGPGLIEPTAFWVLGSLNGQVRQLPTAGAAAPSGAAIGDVAYALDLDGDAVFAGTRGELVRKGLGNASSPMPLATGYANGVLSIDADALAVAFGARSLNGEWTVATIARTGGTVTPLHTTTETIRAVALVGDNVVWLERKRVRRVPRTGGTAMTIATLDDTPWSIAVDGTTLFVATNEGVLNPSGATGRILAIDAITGTVEELATRQAEPIDIAVDASFVYWANRGLTAGSGQIMRLVRE